MKPILVIIHIYYPNLWTELKKCLQNIPPYPFELYVTLVKKNEVLEKDIRRSFPSAHIQIVENRGYDVGPFIHILGQVNLDNYSYLVKLHTKRTIKSDNKFLGKNALLWRDNLLFPYQDKKIFQTYLNNFERYPIVGMQGCYQLFVKNNLMGDRVFDKYSYKNFGKFLKKNNLKKLSFSYLAGTMFVVRAKLFKEIQKLNLTLNDFSLSNRKEKGSSGHILERFFGYTIYHQGYILRDTLVPEAIEQKISKKKIMSKLFGLVARFFYQKKTTLSGHSIIKICKIPVYRRKNVSTH